MTPAEFTAALDRLGFNQSSLARQLKVSDRMVRFWVAGAYPVPETVSLLLRLMLATNTSAARLPALTKGKR
jgi:DNA-binding transcriptional regulator YiaG